VRDFQTMSAENRLPPFEDLAEVVNAIALQSASVSNLPYGGQSRAEIETCDEAYSGGEVQNPVKFCHEIAGIYLQGAGDYLYGAAQRADPRFNLAFSSAALGRGACEFAAWSWWMQDDSITAAERVSRAIGIFRSDMSHPGNAGQYGVSGEELIQELDDWASAQPYTLPRGGPKVTEILDLMNPGLGSAQYKYLSGITHGRLTPMLQVHHNVRNSPIAMQCDHWARLLIGSGAVLRAMDAMCLLRGQQLDLLDELRPLFEDYVHQFENFVASTTSN
jgi:hypothetical protein